jgi:hypothetical protein
MSQKNLFIGQQVQACLWGLLAITGFSLTLPATKLAVPFFGVTAVGFGRAAITQCQATPDRRNFELNFIKNYKQ